MEVEPTPSAFDETIEALRERVSRNLGLVAASKNLSPPHAAFRRQVEDDARRSAESSWHSPIFNSPLEKRRLRILQGLFYGLSRLDCSVDVRGREVRDIHVTVGHQHVKIELERTQTRRRPSDGEPPERLKFSISGHRGERMSWIDTDEQPLETQLSIIGRSSSPVSCSIASTGELTACIGTLGVKKEVIGRGGFRPRRL